MNPSELIDLALARFGGAVVAASDEFFAPAANLLKPEAPVFVAGKYTDRGKWMDGWETRRRRVPGHDWVVIRLGIPGVIRAVEVDTTHFRGNAPESVSIAASADGEEWVQIVPRTPVRPDSRNLLAVVDDRRWTHVRLDIHPDGGVARLRVYGVGRPERIERELDLAAAANGATIDGASDEAFGSARAMLLPGDAEGMWDGWETRRRRGEGYDWAVVRLAVRGIIRRIVVDTSHFKGNAPADCRLEVRDGEFDTWNEILPWTPLEPDRRHEFAAAAERWVTHARLSIRPDGGVARLRLHGSSDPVVRINAWPREDAVAAFLRCSGSRRWAEWMADRRPVRDFDELVTAAVAIWRSLEPEDWLESFAAHARIGEATDDPRARREQAAAQSAPEDVRRAFSEANAAYEKRFGFKFIVFARGRSAEEMLAILRRRMENDRERELRIAAAEEEKIIRARLAEL
jgi:allantoicase